jgi:acetyltransferase-like isoleucine patch superfamily enzyme
MIMPVIANTWKKLKRWHYTRLAKKACASYQSPLYVNKASKFTSHTHIGRNAHFNGMQIRGSGKVTIGDNFHSGNECVFITQNHNYKGDKIPYDNTYIIKDIKIEDNVWLGFRVMIMPGVTIGEGAIIQAGSVVVSDIPKCAIAGGHPAKVFAYRDKERYENLKSEGKFN